MRLVVICFLLAAFVAAVSAEDDSDFLKSLVEKLRDLEEDNVEEEEADANVLKKHHVSAHHHLLAKLHHGVSSHKHHGHKHHAHAALTFRPALKVQHLQ